MIRTQNLCLQSRELYPLHHCTLLGYNLPQTHQTNHQENRTQLVTQLLRHAKWPFGPERKLTPVADPIENSSEEFDSARELTN